jgi:hypothetical protein
MYFITNREPKGSFAEQTAGVRYHFDLDKNAPSNSVYYCERNSENDYMEIGSTRFMVFQIFQKTIYFLGLKVFKNYLMKKKKT